MSKISEILIREFKKKKNLIKIIDFSEAKKAREELFKFNSGLSKIAKDKEIDPSYKVYIQIQNMLSYFAEELAVFKELRDFSNKVEKLEFEFMPAYPPISPITNSYFGYFCLCDLRFGKKKETISTIFKDIGIEYNFENLFIKAIDNLIQSSMRFYLCVKVEDGLVELKDILTGEKEICVSTTNYLGKPGEIWFVRLVPNLDEKFDYKIVLTTPYIVMGQKEEDWLKFFERQGIKKGDLDLDTKILRKMKYNIDLKYWLNYIMDAYVNYESNCIFLTGIPDIKGSKPHEM
jgi:hypothetical protein